MPAATLVSVRIACAGHFPPGWPTSRDGEDITMTDTNGERSMPEPDNRSAITRDRYDAVLLDLDGVITDTAGIHARCWKQMFDEYLQKRAAQTGEAFHPFEIA